MYCEKCGSENLEGATLCQNCGGVFVFSKPSRTSGLAVASIILGISGITMFALMGIAWIIGLIFGILALHISGIIMFGLMGISWIISLVFGILSLNKINKSSGLIRGKGFAITGITTSSSGLASLLVIIGIVMFFTSAQTLSTRRRLTKMQDSGLITVLQQGQPKIDGQIYIFAGQGGSAENCSGILFTPTEAAGEVSDISHSLKCILIDELPIKVTWQFTSSDDQRDNYSFAVTVAVNKNSTKTMRKMIAYDGTEQVVFKDEMYKIVMTPPEPKQQKD